MTGDGSWQGLEDRRKHEREGGGGALNDYGSERNRAIYGFFQVVSLNTVLRVCYVRSPPAP